MGALRDDRQSVGGTGRFANRSGNEASGCPGPGVVVRSNSEPLIKQRFVTAGCGVTAHANRLSSSPWVIQAAMSTRSLRRTKTQTDQDRRAVVPVR
jgi:hypothetical protein